MPLTLPGGPPADPTPAAPATAAPAPGRSRRSALRRAVAPAAAASLALTGLGAAGAAAAPAPERDLARTALVTASASQDDADGTFPVEALTDGDPGTRWASGNGPDADVVVEAAVTADLGVPADVRAVEVDWEAAYATRYAVQVSDVAPGAAGASWETVEVVEDGDGGEDVLDLGAAGDDVRAVRLQMLERRSQWDWDPGVPHRYGYSAFALRVLGTTDVSAAAFPAATTAAEPGTTATVPVRLGQPADRDATVRVTSTGGGDAVVGEDVAAVDAQVAFLAGETEASVEVPVLEGATPGRTAELALSDPTDAVALGARTTTSLVVAAPEAPPAPPAPVSEGEVTVLDAFDAEPLPVFAWGSGATTTPQLSLVPAEREGTTGSALRAQVAEMPDGGWGGFTHDHGTAQDWSAADGFGFWFLGRGTGRTLAFELKSGGTNADSATKFEVQLADDAEGWRRVAVRFTDLREKGAPGSDARFDPSTVFGYAVTLSALGAGDWRFDDVGTFTQRLVVDDFEGDLPLAAPGTTTGIFGWGASDDAVPSIGQEQLDRPGAPTDNRVLAGEYSIPSGQYGGLSHNLAETQDWSSYGAFEMWWYASQDSNPASPTAGNEIVVELKDGGTDGERSELWRASFLDRWGSAESRWKHVVIPFEDFALSGYQPGDAATRNGTLDLDRAWGYAVTFTPGTPEPVRYRFDDVAVSGSPAPVVTTSVEAAQDVVLVAPGETATAGLRLGLSGDEPLAEDLVLDWAVSDPEDPGTGAVVGEHVAAASGQVVLPAGSVDGDVATFEVPTLRGDAEEDYARTIALEVTAPSGVQVSSVPRVVLDAYGFPYLDTARPTDERVADLLGRMTLAEKVGQMAQAERLGLSSPQQIAELGLGSVLSGGGSVPEDNTPAGWADMVDGFQREALSTRLQVPIVYGVDAVHGHNNVVGATLFPHNIGMGAARDPELVRAEGRVTAAEVRATGIPWTFAPCLCVTRDERWGRSYESFSEDPALVEAYAAPAVQGLQGDDPSDITASDEVLATAKHWVGDGGTDYDPALAGSGYPIDQGITRVKSLEELRRLHVDPYLPAIEAGVGTVMPSYSAVQVGDGPVVRMTENEDLNVGLLKGELGFDGFLISDWEAVDKLPGGTYADKVERSLTAGMDMVMAPYNFGAFIAAATDGVEAGRLPVSRVDDAVTRILTEKMDAGLFEQPFADRSGVDEVGSPEHRAVAREAAAASQVLLANGPVGEPVLPLAKEGRIYIAGSSADDLGRQLGGWSISWQGGSGATTEGTTIADGIAEVAPDADVVVSPDASADMTGADVGVVVVGERPYAEGQGDVGGNGFSLQLTDADRATVAKVCSAVEDCVVLLATGRPLVLGDVLDSADAVVATWLPGTEGAGVADVLFGDRPFSGRLPVTWPAAADQVPVNQGDDVYDPAFPYGWGLSTTAPRAELEAVAADLGPGAVAARVRSALRAPVWTADGDVRDSSAARATAGQRLLAVVEQTQRGRGKDADVVPAVVEVLRDVAQADVVAGDAAPGAAALVADAEHALVSGDAVTAARRMAEVVAER
ncbi:glycoside hydrolase family 3 N-terminal domain-containing protein [Pseudokineococcus marinus]|uniref:beta-glucosidase n=1 Tax=Pseudokineococcus marinus TaxID=351215 RepID=A0A849C199_9ACTN|nr:glycoside hydrolase family 3 N-terminal domain-containing protein [Pseudokineococcus marinus]NNH23468.1 glycoside hydrolase family 3 [Pseudokineococcus marinus]